MIARRRTLAALVLLAAVVAAWLFRRPLLVAAGRALVDEDPIARVELIVVSNTGAHAGAFEAARLYHEGVAGRIALIPWRYDPIDDEIRRVGVPLLTPTQLVTEVLVREGVPREAVVVVPGRADGTGPEVTAVAAFARRSPPESLLFITARSHTARARWLLRHELPPGIRVLVRSPRTDEFSADAWWRSRGQTRELMIEYLRWTNSTILGDHWSREAEGDRDGRPASDAGGGAAP